MLLPWLSIAVPQEQTSPNTNTLDLIPIFVMQQPLWWSGSLGHNQQSKANSLFRIWEIFEENKDVSSQQACA